jgi:hypothetical protein
MKTKIVIRPVRLLLLCLTVVMGTSCASFHWGEYSYQELKDRQQAQRENNALMFKPGTFLGTW